MPPVRFSLLACSLWISVISAGEFPTPTNNQSITGSPLSDPDRLVEMMTLPEGFKATVFAAEPEVRNPIAMCWDERGRMWVAENYTYSDHHERFDLKLRDRIIILEDTDGDGRSDRRTIFADDFQRLTSIERGLGGIYALAPPHLLFIPCENDIPTGTPQILLDGFGIEGAQRHTIANGLKWGPDGWLYGRAGISRTSYVGVPGTPKAERPPLAGGIWRFHPTQKRFETYCHGTTNPWGSDWNEDGELFFINTVIGHFWHAIPGAHFKRMYGNDPHPHIYELIDQHADHYHWDTGDSWQASRKNTPTTDELGGGHAHVGMSIYQGDQFPVSYRGKVFTTNLHGRRINVERLEPKGSGFIAKHEPDFMTTTDPWFRAVEVTTGPDGSLFVLDWSDIGECHEHDGVHRTSGRIYRISYGTPATANHGLRRLDDRQLVELQLSTNEWKTRMARWELRERVHRGGQDQLDTIEKIILDVFPKEPAEHSERAAMRKLWLRTTLSTTEEPAASMMAWLEVDTPALHRQIIKVLSDDPDSSFWSEFTSSTWMDKHPSSRLAVASTLQKLRPLHQARIAKILMSDPEDAADHNLSLVIWSGIRELPPKTLVELFPNCEHPKVQRFIARRVAEEIDRQPEILEALLSIDSQNGVIGRLRGMIDAFQGRNSAPKPKNWQAFSSSIPKGPTTRIPLLKLSLLFGDREALQSLIHAAQNRPAPIESRRLALETLVEIDDPALRSLYESMLDDKSLAPIAIRGLAKFKDLAIAQRLIRSYPNFNQRSQAQSLAILSSRASWADLLLEHIGDAIPPEAITAPIARNISLLSQPKLTEKLAKLVNPATQSGQQLTEQIATLRDKLTPAFIARGKPSRGRLLFQQYCASCHKLFGEGGTIGPDLTGGGRQDPAYLLQNIVDPNAEVAESYKLSVLHLKDGRVLAGTIREQNDLNLTLNQTDTTTTIPHEQIRKQERLPTSMMPAGLLDALDDTQLADLISYLTKPHQVPLPK